MILTIADTYEELSKLAADDLIQILKDRKNPLLCTASGDTPTGLYKQLMEHQQSGEIDAAQWYFAGLDEWVGKNGSDEGSSRYYLDQQLYHPLQIPAEHISFFDGRAADLNEECRKMEAFIQQHHITVAVVGLGMNGHIGFNEPGVSLEHRTHVVDLDETTKKVGQKYFKEQQVLTQGITIGFAALMEAEHIFLMASGTHKAAIIQQVLEGPETAQVPGSLLRRHPNLHVYLDKEAAQLLTTLEKA
ncbi:MAG: glucosamine-6-phosphate deaminase [Flavisolibacter sp.]|nr:glucosamine-6-phosphate deaminase [Flavisolibacter sp.]